MKCTVFDQNVGIGKITFGGRGIKKGMVTRFGIGRKIAARWRWVLAVAVCALALFAGMRPLRDELALSKLEKQIDYEIANFGNLPQDSRKRMSAYLVDALEWSKLGVPNWLTAIVVRRNDVVPTSADQLIASSRWPLRQRMGDSILRNIARSEFLLQNWKDYFPAIIGADVTLEHRREWISHLDTLRMDASLTRTPRQAVVFCMALVILTDPPEFETWRVPVRDAMLGWPELLRIEVTWMRTLDTLLAMDPPESWVALTKPLTANHDPFRYAMAVPVRGLAGHIDALSREFEFFESRNHPEYASDFWVGAGTSLEAWPDALRKSETAKIRDWRRDVLFRWLMDQSKFSGSELIHSGNFAPVEFTPEQQSQLAVAAADLARLASEEIDSEDGRTKLRNARRIRLIREICHYLTNAKQAEVGSLLIPVMLRPDFFARSRSIKFIHFDPDWVKLLWKIQPLMSVDERRTLQTRLAPIMGRLSYSDPSSSALLCMDAWSDMPALSPEKWLANAWHFRFGWRIVPRNTPRESLDPFTDGPLPVPPVSDSVAKTLAKHLDAAFSTGDPKTFTKTFNDRLNGGDPSAPISQWLTHKSYSEIRNWQSFGGLASHSLAERLEMALYRCGLRELNGAGLPALKALVRNDRDFYWWWSVFNRPGNLIDPWSEAGMDPQEAVRWIGYEEDMVFLDGVVMCMEKFPPDAAIIRAIWDELRQRSQNASIENQPPIYGALCRLSRWLPSEERLAMRRDFKGFPARVFTDGYGWGEPDSPLLYLGGGLGIPWEDDKLSAVHSWRSNFERQVHLYPDMPIELYANDVFSFLALGSYREPRSSQWPQKPTALPRLSVPFEPTPWQRARELHLRRPDLDPS